MMSFWSGWQACQRARVADTSLVGSQGEGQRTWQVPYALLVVGFAVATLLTAICRLVAGDLGYGALVRLAVAVFHGWQCCS